VRDLEGLRAPDGSAAPLPNYRACIAISTKSSLEEMLMPGLLAVFCPLVIGFTFGSHCLGGFLIGAIASGYLLGVQMSNTGGAWDNAKKWVEADGLKIKGYLRPKKSMEHQAVVVGDTVGDPLKDTSGPSLNILIKLMTGFSFVIAELLDAYWGNFWIGICLGCAMLVVGIIVQVFLLSTPAVSDDHYETEKGMHEKFDFLDGAIRRMDKDLARLGTYPAVDRNGDVDENNPGSGARKQTFKHLKAIKDDFPDAYMQWEQAKMQPAGDATE